ncbi:hypothetical protein GPECTOR_25g461 [Gonium pectorale]|uniref:procollagen-proline 4-dioxygenase n=1 Tax=Gonium pectorale TaxID=33097 RepID=A0A150GGC4_GONPE|nr:hypothetical protein GPECTOR_25g461 [Gonium pectorale]|eukprot:KXZ48876.1 hypothetical protein GPECTOR_25g461 [Gonium pectorale]
MSMRLASSLIVALSAYVLSVPTAASRRIETISWNPRAFVHHNFLTEAECDHLVHIGTQRVSRSLVVDSATGQSKLDDIRTSYGAAFSRAEDPVIAEIEERIAEWTHIPPAHGEPIQILRYENGQKYDAHWDWFDDPVHHKMYLSDGNRYATVLLYLSEVEEGGETNLPLADPIDLSVQAIENPSPCAAKMGLSIKPRKGDALLFFDMDIQGSKGDRKALHASCPTLKARATGMKWTATKWIHNKVYMGKYDPMRMAAKCEDAASDCASRVAAGECTSNMDKMMNQNDPRDTDPWDRQKMGKGNNDIFMVAHSVIFLAIATAVTVADADLPRTFPGHPYLSCAETGQAAMRRILTAYSLHNPLVGYCQGLNFVAGVILVAVDRDEELTFWLLAALIERILYQGKDLDLVAEKIPKLSEHMARIGCEISLIATDWFLTVFCVSLPSESACRVLDALFHEGAKVLFRVALALLHSVEPQLLKIDNAGEFMRWVKEYMAGLHHIDPLMTVAFEGIGSLSLSAVDAVRKVKEQEVRALMEQRRQARNQQQNRSAART